MTKPTRQFRHRRGRIRRRRSEVVVKYMILLQSNPQFLERWQALPKEQRERFGRDHLALSAELADTGELVAIEALADPALAKRVTVTGEQTMISDGPFAEVKEHLAGFLLVDCEDEDRALAIAARVPDALWGLVEVRPVLDLSEWDM
ncbi:MAG TPA: YciI family protein [Jatrophihabitans sp.]